MVDRRVGRITALKALYARELSDEGASHILETVIGPAFQKSGTRNIKKFAESLFLRTIKNQEVLDTILDDHTRNWKLSRLAVMDKLILRMALAEFLYFEEIPVKVTINEAIEIAKDFSTKKSGSFINGILDSASDTLKKENRLVKKGRGLIESS